MRGEVCFSHGSCPFCGDDVLEVSHGGACGQMMTSPQVFCNGCTIKGDLELFRLIWRLKEKS